LLIVSWDVLLAISLYIVAIVVAVIYATKRSGGSKENA
jgi:hypothetical protein